MDDFFGSFFYFMQKNKKKLSKCRADACLLSFYGSLYGWLKLETYVVKNTNRKKNFNEREKDIRHEFPALATM